MQSNALFEAIDTFFGRFVVAPLSQVLFWDVLFWDDEVQLPIVVLWLILGALLLTLRMALVNVRAFGHAVAVTLGRYDDPEAQGEVSHFQALSSALSATLGLGNIAGVAIAIGTGGPGATLWMILAGLLGMSSKFTEVTLGQQFRQVRADGRVMGGAMYYLSLGLAERGLPRLGRVLAVLFCLLCIGGSLGGGNSFQVSQSLSALQTVLPWLREYPWVYGLLMTVLVGVVIVGGIRRIAVAASAIMPLMSAVYVGACLYILASRLSLVPEALWTILEGAFTPRAAFGGVIGVMVTGFRRAAFSNEAGIGSAPIAHAAARTTYPVREGIVALLEPFIDTVVICTMTALVIVLTGAWDNPAHAHLVRTDQGAALTSAAMREVIPWFPYVLAVAVLLFAYSTMVSWSYYGERCSVWLFGERATAPYHVLFLTFVFLGSIITATNLLVFGDLMILAMAFPNLLGVVLLSGRVRRELDAYLAGLREGSIRRYR
jgi:alanine or glycine:cation symporter, AGCS family